MDLMDKNQALSKYEDILFDLLYGKVLSLERHGRRLDHLLQSMIREHNLPLRRFDELLRDHFNCYANSLIADKIDEKKPWEVIANRIVQYSMRFISIIDHVRSIVKEFRDYSMRPLEIYLKHRFVELLLQPGDGWDCMLLKHFREACKHYVFDSEDCGSQINLIYRSVRDFEVDYELAETYEFGNNLQDIQDYIHILPHPSFSELYKIWIRAAKLFELTGYWEGSVSGLELLFEDNPDYLMDSLDGILLNNLDMEALSSLKKDGNWSGNWSDKLCGAYVNQRRVKFLDDDFDQLLRSILLQKYNSYYGYDLQFPIGERESIPDKDVPGFHSKLISFLDFSFKNNYSVSRKKVEKTPQVFEGDHESPSKDAENWAHAASILVELFTPQPLQLLQRYIQESLMPQLIMLNAKFPEYYKHKNCIQRLWIEKLRQSRSIEIISFFPILDDVLDSVKSDQMVNGSDIKLAKLYVPERIRSKVFPNQKTQHVKTPLWPSPEMKNQWDQEVEAFAEDGKCLEGLFTLHTVTMTSPFRLPNGRRLSILTTLAIAKIILLIDQCGHLCFSEICCTCRIDDDDDQAEVIADGLRKLSDCGILINNEGSASFSINKAYVASDVVAKSGVIRCI